MKKQIYLTILIVASLLFAQSLKAQPEFSVVAGPLYSTIMGDSDSYNGTIGAQAGVIVNVLNLSQALRVLAELNVSLQGAGWDEGEYKGRTNLLYANVPLVLRYQSESGFYGEAGIQPGLLLSAKDKEDGDSWDIKDYISNLDISIPLGAGYIFENNLGVGIRVIPGLMNVNSDDGDWSEWTDHNFVVAFRVIYTFKKK